jgi:clan AA aspartic protease (TIGR02281 family)
MITRLLLAGVAALAVVGCASRDTPPPPSAGDIDRFCRDPRISSSVDAAEQCVRLYSTHPEFTLPQLSPMTGDVTQGYGTSEQPSQAYPTSQSSETEAALTTDQGTKTVTGIVNAAISARFMIDFGASYVQIPLPLAMRLADLGTFDRDDYVKQASFELADGSESGAPVVRLHSLTVGGVTLNDVLASIGGEGSDVLLGQSFLNRLGSWSIDNSRSALVMRQS